MKWRCLDRTLDLTRCGEIMGIVNVTPDSFSDGGLFATVDAAVEQAKRLIGEGAVLIDIGGESTRPGAAEVNEAEELRRVLPVISRLAAECPDTILSIDTCKAAVAAAAVAAGAKVINDVRGFRDQAMVEVAAASGAGLVLMHMRGTPSTMQSGDLSSSDIVAEVCEVLAERLQLALDAGIERDAVVLDPGIGFGKTQAQNLALLRGLDRLLALGRPVLVGVSRKSLIGHLTGRPVEARLAGSLGGALGALHRGARIVRVHDVADTRDALRVMLAVLGEDDRDGQSHA